MKIVMMQRHIQFAIVRCFCVAASDQDCFIMSFKNIIRHRDVVRLICDIDQAVPMLVFTMKIRFRWLRAILEMTMIDPNMRAAADRNAVILRIPAAVRPIVWIPRREIIIRGLKHNISDDNIIRVED